MSDNLILKDGTVIEKGQKIQINCRSYRFIDKWDGSCEEIQFGEHGVYKFIGHTKDGIIVSDIELGGTIFVYTGPDRVTKEGAHMRRPEITLPQVKKPKGVKRKKKTVVEMGPTVIGSKKNEEPLKKRRGRPPKAEGESSRKAISGKKKGRGRPKKKGKA